MKLIQYPQEISDMEITDKIISLINTAWTENKIFPSAPNTYLTSFVLIENEKAVCHVGIRKSILFHKGEKYSVYGLSEVVTHPSYQNKGFASQVIKKALQFIIFQQADISIFTCAKEKISFYTKRGWKAVPGACLVGGTKNKPFRSDDLNLTTMMLFISEKGIQHKKDFINTDIILDLGDNQLW